VRTNAQISRPASYIPKSGHTGAGFEYAQPALPERSRREHEFSLGQRVFHNTFGEGMIIDLEGSGARTRVQINFGRAGTKWLMLTHANLQAL